MKYVMIIIMLITGCVHPDAVKSTKIDKNEMIMCRTMCNKNAKSYSPLTGECDCYPNK